MKKFLTFPIVTILVIVILFVMLLSSTGFNVEMFNPKEPRVFITDTLPKFSNPWNSDVMNKYMSGIEEKTINTLCDDLQSMFGNCFMQDITWKGTTINTNTFYTYAIDLSCEKGLANVGVSIVKNGINEYKYVGFHVSRGQ